MPTSHAPAGSRLGRRNDPDRRDRIIDACLEVISHAGVAGTSHRRVAAAAGVPLGAMTYYFDGMDDLLREAFTRFATDMSDRFLRRMRDVHDLDAARTAVRAIILEDVFGSDRELVLAHELYTLAAREPVFRSITSAWMTRSRAALEPHFDQRTASMIDAMIEGLTIHRALDAHPRDAQEVDLAIARITGAPRAAAAPADRPEIVCISGSARFAQEMRALNLQLTLAGCIVVAPSEADGPVTDEQKHALDAIHLQKIDLADRLIVVNPGGYIGESTRNEIAHALATGTPVSFTDEPQPTH